MERRAEKRKVIETLEVKHIINNDNLRKVFESAEMVNTSLTGFLITVTRDDIVDPSLRDVLSLNDLNGCSMSLYVESMALELEGIVSLTRHKGKGNFEVLVNFSEDTPHFWRECLMELLPHPGEITD